MSGRIIFLIIYTPFENSTTRITIFLGELLRKYREKYLDKPLATAQEKESLYRENFYQQIESVKNELLSKSTEAEAFKSRNMELEECQLRQEDAINAMKRQTKKICVSYKFFKFYDHFWD